LVHALACEPLAAKRELFVRCALRARARAARRMRAGNDAWRCALLRARGRADARRVCVCVRGVRACFFALFSSSRHRVTHREVRARLAADAQLAWRLASSASASALAAPLARALADCPCGDASLLHELSSLSLLLGRAGGAAARDALTDALARRACEAPYGAAGAAGVLGALTPLLALNCEGASGTTAAHPHPLGRAPEALLDACCRALRSPRCARARIPSLSLRVVLLTWRACVCV
jgi:hypothetical protein